MLLRKSLSHKYPSPSSEVTSDSNQDKMVGTKSPNSADPTYLRKIRKPMVEKRRRDRINNCLDQLKSLLAVKVKNNGTSAMARLDKADILELTVSHLTTLEHQQRSVSLATTADQYKEGFKDCARETFNYLSSTKALDTGSLQQLNNHLQTCYMEKTGRTSSYHQPAEAVSAHASSRHDVVRPKDTFSYASLAKLPSSFAGQTVFVPSISSSYGYERYYKEHEYYNKCNDSVDTSFNSTCNMSLDSSSNVTPEKVVPSSDTDDDVWRPW